MRAKRAMRRTVFGSATKFCPSARLGVILFARSRSPTWERVSVTHRDYSPLDANVDDAAGRIRERFERLFVQVDDASVDLRTAVSHATGDAAAVLLVGDGHDGAERQR